jgi:hypothetical protein
MTPQPTLRPDLAAACLFVKRPERRAACPQPPAVGVLAELVRLRSSQ